MSDWAGEPAVGIDLGTTFSAVAYLDAEGRPVTVRNAEGELITPSAVFFDRSGPIVGAEALEAGQQEPERLARFAKRDMGEQAYEKRIRGEQLPPELIQALVLRKLRADAELKLGPFQKAVVTVPAFFNEPCRKATQDAGQLAGLDVIDIINEPTAAAIMYGVEQGFLSREGVSHQRERILVYDLGGGTFDVTLMEIDGANYQAIATAGDVYLGGVDWDMRLVDMIAERFEEEFGIDPRQDPCALEALRLKASHAKHALTARQQMSVFFEYEGHRMRVPLARTEFEKRTEDLLERTMMTVRMVLSDAALSWQDLTRVLLVGGSTRMPMVHRALESASGKRVDRSLSPDEAVAHGAAIYAGLLLSHPGPQRRGMSVVNVNSHDLGVLALEPSTGSWRRRTMIGRNTQLPTTRRCVFVTHKPGQRNVVVRVVEGGDDSGTNATPIGKCVVSDLPPELPKGTPVEVLFQYGQDGRLAVTARLPDAGRSATLVLDRAGGLSAEKLNYWKKRMEEGLGDDSVPVAPGEAAPAEAAPAEVAPADWRPEDGAGSKSEAEADELPKIDVAPTDAVAARGRRQAVPSPRGSTPPEPAAAEASKITITPDEAQPAARQAGTAAPVKKLRKVKKLSPPAASPPGSGGWKSRRRKLTPGEQEHD